MAGLASSRKVAPRKDGLYAKKDSSNYQRFVESIKQQVPQGEEAPSPLPPPQQLAKGPAPLVGWHDGSPTLRSPDDPAQPDELAKPETPSESSGIGRDDDEDDDEEDEEDEREADSTENLSSIADERGAATSAPRRLRLLDKSLDKSLESFSQEAGSSSLGSEPDCSDPRLESSPTTAPASDSPATERLAAAGAPAPCRCGHPQPAQQQQAQGILVRKQYLQPEPLGQQLKRLEPDSIDGSSAMLEIYDDDDDDEDDGDEGEDDDDEEAGRPRKRRAKAAVDGSARSKIPDGGWGWVVVASSLCISMIADGVSFSFGLLYIEFLYEFGESKSTTAWIGSLFMAVPLLSGPIMSALVDRYGCRKMTILGGLISGTGFVLSSYVNSIGVMYLTFGLVAGLGLGLCYVTAVVSIAFWFDKKRTLAVGLGACGTGVGTFVYAPMTTYFIEEYGWRGCVLLLAGTFFNMIVCGTVMRDPEWLELEQPKQQQQQQQHQQQQQQLQLQQQTQSLTPNKSQHSRSNQADGSAARSQNRSPAVLDDDFPGVDELRRLLKSGKAPEYLLQNLSTSTEARSGAVGNPAFRSVVNLPTFVRQSEKVPLEVLESLSANSRLYNVILENYPSLLLCRSSSDKKLDDPSSEENKSGVTMSMRLKQAKDKGKKNQSRQGSTHGLATRRMSIKDLEEVNPLLAKEVAHAIAEAEKAKSISRHHLPGCGAGVVRTDSLPWLRRQFSTNTHYFRDIKVHRNSVMYRGAVLNLHKYRLRASSCPDIYRNSMTTLAKENEEKWYSELVDLLKGMTDFSMFSELHFLLLSLSTILLFTWFIVPYFYLAEHLTRQGYPESLAADLLSYIGLTNTIGMIGLGWAGDQPWMNVTKTYTVCLVACGISTILMPIFTHHHYGLVATSCCFGLFFASNFSFTPVILVEIIPLERFTTAYGLSLLCQGIGNLLGPPLAGWLFDVTGAWDLSFIMAGSWIIVSGLLMGIIPYTKNRKIWGSGPVETEKERAGEALA